MFGGFISPGYFQKPLQNLNAGFKYLVCYSIGFRKILLHEWGQFTVALENKSPLLSNILKGVLRVRNGFLEKAWILVREIPCSPTMSLLPPFTPNEKVMHGISFHVPGAQYLLSSLARLNFFRTFVNDAGRIRYRLPERSGTFVHCDRILQNT